MEKMEFQEKWKKIVIYMAMIAVSAILKAAPAYAGDFTAEAALLTDGWSGDCEICEIAEGTTDYYKFTTSTVGYVAINLMPYAYGLECIVYDSNLEKIGHIRCWDFDKNKTFPQTEQWLEWLPDGTYYVSVSVKSGKGGKYKLYASLPSDGVTMADLKAAATLPTNGAWGKKCEMAEETTDCYQFTISAAGEVVIKLMAYTYKMECILYDSNFDWVGCIWNDEDESWAGWLSQGTYYISISERHGKGGEYKLCASFSSSGMTAAEEDSYASPQKLRINGKVSGVLTDSNNADWYRVRITSAGKYRYIFRHPNDMECYLYDSKLSELDAVYNLDAGTESREIELKPGIYYIKIKSFLGVGYGIYTCQIKEAVPEKGDVLTDSKNQAQYKVTKAGKSGGTVTCLKSMDGMKASVTVPATVRIDGITYKVTGIADGAFKGSAMLKKVTVGKNVTSIGKNAFYNCRNLKTVTIKSSGLKKVGKNALKGINPTAKVKVPAKKLPAYKKLLKNKGQGKNVKITK